MLALRFLAFAILLLVGSSARAQPYVGILSGTAEQPPNASPGTGTARVTVDSALNTLTVDVAFSGLLAGTTVAHIHCCVAPPGNVGVATQTPSFAGFPSGVTAGTHSQILDLTAASSFNPAFITAHGGTVAGAAAALRTGLANGQAYFNIHTSMFAGGEIRSFLLLSDDIFGDGFETPDTALSLLRCDTPADGSLVDLVPGADVAITGTALGLSDVQVNGAPVVVAADRTFSTAVTGRYGLNFVELSGTDGAGATRTGLCAFLGAERWLTEGARFDEALLFRLEPTGLNKLTSMLPTWFSGPNLPQSLDSSLAANIGHTVIGNCGPFGTCADIQYLSLSVTTDFVSITVTNEQTLRVVVQLDIRLRLRASGKEFGTPSGPIEGDALFANATVRVDVVLYIDPATGLPGGRGDSVNNVDLSAADWSQFNGLGPTIRNMVVSFVEPQLSSSLGSAVLSGAAGLFEGLLAGMDVTLPAAGFPVGRLDGTANVTVAMTRRSAIGLRNAGLYLDTGLRVSAPPPPPVATGRVPLPPAFYPLATRPTDAWSAFHVGVFNQVLQALWRVGLFDGTVDGAALGPGLPAGTSLSVQLRTMPVVTAFDPGGTAGLDVGALDLVVTHPDLPPGLRVTAGARIRAQAALLSDDLVFGNIVVDELHFSTGVVTLDPASQVTLLDLLERLLVKLAGVALNDSVPVLPATIFTFPPSLAAYGLTVGSRLVDTPSLVIETNYVFLEGTIGL